jgi:hypothetical protein
MTGPGIMIYHADYACNWKTVLNTLSLVIWQQGLGNTICGAWFWYLQNDMTLYILLTFFVLFLGSCYKKVFWGLIVLAVVGSLAFCIYFKVYVGTLYFLILYYQNVFRFKSYFLAAYFCQKELDKKESKKQKEFRKVENTEGQEVDIENSRTSILTKKKKKKSVLAFLAQYSLISAFILLFYAYRKNFQLPVEEIPSELPYNYLYTVFGPLAFSLTLINGLGSIFKAHPMLYNFLKNSKLLTSAANLSFTMYAVHYVILQINAYSFEKYPRAESSRDYWRMYVTSLMWVYACGLFCAVVIELPFANMWKIYVERKFVKKPAN